MWNIIVEYHNHVAVNGFTIDVRDHRQVTSLNAFRRRQIKRSSDAINKKLWQPRHFEIFDITSFSIEKFIFPELDRLTFLHFTDIWKLYEMIGYDHVRDKFL